MSHSDQRQLPNAYATTVMVAIGVAVVNAIMMGYIAYQRIAALFRLADGAIRQLSRKAGDRR